MMKKIFIIILLLITSQSFSQDCNVDISDSIRPIVIENLGKSKFEHEVDAADLYYEPYVFVSCSLYEGNWRSELVNIKSFEYKLFRKGIVISMGNNNSMYYYSTPIRDIIKNTEVGDSLIFTNFNISLNKLKNVTLKSVYYKIVKNSIYKPDINHKKGLSKIYSYKKIKKFLEIYGSSCGSAPNYYVTKVPYYSDDSSKVVYPYKFIDYDGRYESVFQDISFVYYVKTERLTVLGNKDNKEQSIEDWIKIIEKKLQKPD